MAKAVRRPAPRRGRSRARRNAASGIGRPGDPAPISEENQTTLQIAEDAAQWATDVLLAAEAAALAAVVAAEEAEALAVEAVKAATVAEQAARWVLVDAHQMVNAASAQVDAAQNIVNVEGQAIADLQGNDNPLDYSVSYAEGAQARAIDASLDSVRRAMAAASSSRRGGAR